MCAPPRQILEKIGCEIRPRGVLSWGLHDPQGGVNLKGYTIPRGVLSWGLHDINDIDSILAGNIMPTWNLIWASNVYYISGQWTLSLVGQIDNDLDNLDISLPLWAFSAGSVHGTDPTQETCSRSCTLYGSHPATAWARSYRSYRSYRSGIHLACKI